MGVMEQQKNDKSQALSIKGGINLVGLKILWANRDSRIFAYLNAVKLLVNLAGQALWKENRN